MKNEQGLSLPGIIVGVALILVGLLVVGGLAGILIAVVGLAVALLI